MTPSERETRKLSEPAAWRVIATEGPSMLCIDVSGLRGSGRIPDSLANRMCARVQTHMQGHGGARAVAAYGNGSCGDYPTDNEFRVYAALWLALEAEEDARREPSR